MGLFGRKANQQSTKSDVPPELQPYFDGKSFPARVRRVLSSAAPLIISLIIIAGIIAGGVWLLRNRSANTKNEQQTTTQTQTTLRQGSPTQITPSPSPAGSTPESTTTPTASAESAIPNTGPGEMAFITAALATVFGMAIYYIRQIRLLGRSGN